MRTQVFALCAAAIVAACSAAPTPTVPALAVATPPMSTPPDTTLHLATLANGCFWCTEAVFQQLQGVHKVVSGYTGGHVANPTYRAVCDGTTGHAECLQISYDPNVISFAELLEVFFNTHDPTTLNRQGNDVGTQYRSGIYYHTPEQKATSEAYIAQLNASKVFPAPIVTEVTAFGTFYPAEDYHQNYFLDNPNQGYCAFVIRPKVEKFKKQFAGKLRPEGQAVKGGQ